MIRIIESIRRSRVNEKLTKVTGYNPEEVDLEFKHRAGLVRVWLDGGTVDTPPQVEFSIVYATGNEVGYYDGKNDADVLRVANEMVKVIKTGDKSKMKKMFSKYNLY